MENKYLIGLGAIALGMFAYSRYAKKDNSGQGEDSNTGGGGGGIGGGGFMPNFTTPQIPPILPSVPIIPIVTPLKGQVVVPTTPTNPIVISGLGGARPVVAVPSSSTGASNSGTAVRNLGGIAPIPLPQRQTGSVVQISQADLNKGIAGGLVFKPFDGSGNKCKTPIYLNDLVRSWNRP